MPLAISSVGKTLGLWLCLLVMPVVSASGVTQTFIAGKDYETIELSQPQEVPPGGDIEVVEFFSYNCSWCARLEPAIARWRNHTKDTVHFQRIPVLFQQSWVMTAKSYYIAEAFDIEQKISPAIFDAVIKRKFNTEKDIAEIFSVHGVDKKQFINAYYSPSLEIKIQQGNRLVQVYQIHVVPTIVVAGRYKVDNTMVGGDNKKLLAVLDHLIEKVGRTRKG